MGACNVPPSRGQRTGTGQNVHRHSLHRLNASTIKQKKQSRETWVRVGGELYRDP
jgi:hypothetical protein